MDDFDTRYLELMANPASLAAARALTPIQERSLFGRSIFLYDRVPREQLASLGDLRTPTIADVFVAFVGQPDHQPIPPFNPPPAAPSSFTGAAQ
jgi:ABC-2 type transport system ATP-binding protein